MEKINKKLTKAEEELIKAEIRCRTSSDLIEAQEYAIKLMRVRDKEYMDAYLKAKDDVEKLHIELKNIILNQEKK